MAVAAHAWWPIWSTGSTQLGAVVIGFDVVFPEPDRMSPAVAAESFRDLDAETREKLAGLPSNDEVLARAIKAGPRGRSARPARRYRRRARRPRWRCRPASPSRGPIRRRSW